MARFMLSTLTACVVLGVAAARVVDSAPEDRLSFNDLLLQADPYENDIFYEYRPATSIPRRTAPSRPSPTLHLLDSFSKPTYVDASEFRMPLPPSIDINRQLTLLSASRVFRPPTKFLTEKPVAADYDEIVFASNSAPLFRDDFPSEDIEYYQETPEKSLKVVLNSNIDEALSKGPVYSTSMSVSTSVSYSNNTTEKEDNSTNTDDTLSTTLSSVSTTHELLERSTPTPQSVSVKDAVVSSTASPRAAKLLRFDPEEDYPDHSILSPLAHILGGFRGELGPFGGDHATDSFVRGFRPVGF